MFTDSIQRPFFVKTCICEASSLIDEESSLDSTTFICGCSLSDGHVFSADTLMDHNARIVPAA